MTNETAKRLKIIPLGGLEQIGMNITAFEYDDSIVVVDCEGSLLGVKVPRVIDAEPYEPDDISPSPVENSVITGYIQLDGRRTSVIDCIALSEKNK